MLGMSLALGVTTSLKAETPTQTPVQVQLPKARTEGGKPLMQALNERKSTRAFKTEKLPEQVLSNLLWAAWGTNRPDGKRTAPSAMNRQEIDVYVVSAEGTYMYDAKAHALKPVAAGDLRAQTGGQPFVKDAPLNLVYVADTAKMSGGSEQAVWYGAAAGFISQNVYLYCASEGLATVVRGMVDRDVLARALSLRPEQRIVLSQTVGYPG
ncbi:MAG: SagB/ThcOx family dehydrogenase [Acidobacteria bacterium]|nr:MAG: SagB/ThcOx family dehydrogenase [Acidobacteriota bacterium]